MVSPICECPSTFGGLHPASLVSVHLVAARLRRPTDGIWKVVQKRDEDLCAECKSRAG